jgi:hypothetical protein
MRSPLFQEPASPGGLSPPFRACTRQREEKNNHDGHQRHRQTEPRRQGLRIQCEKGLGWPGRGRRVQAVQTGAFTYDPGFTSTASCESKITYIDGDEGILLHRGYPIDELAEHGDFSRPATCCFTVSCRQRRKARFRDRVTRHTMMHEQMQPLLHRFPPRRTPDGCHGAAWSAQCRRSITTRPTSLTRMQRDRASPDDRQDADNRCWPTSITSASRSCIRATISTTRRTSCVCALPCRARSTRSTRSCHAPWTASSSCTPTTSRTPRPRLFAWLAPPVPTRSPVSQPASPACGARLMAAPTKRRSTC